ncbi:MAG: TSUP family transporter, partial [Actinomycetota bacterium]|nr:TSUP family transporter [Actinomycetota bacterium]
MGIVVALVIESAPFFEEVTTRFFTDGSWSPLFAPPEFGIWQLLNGTFLITGIAILVAIPLGIAIGLVVGAIGGGGAILALPVLVYILGEEVGPASTGSLVVVAIAAGVGAGALALRGHVCWRVALTFTAPAAAGSVLGSVANTAVGTKALILMFVPVMLVASAATWQRAAQAPGEDPERCPDVPARRIVGAAVGVGLLTGFFGVGGGFLIVPVLALSLGFGFRRAVATSLVIITLTGCAALVSHLAIGASIDVPVTIALALATGVGALLGSHIADRVPQATLGRASAVVVALLALFLL